MAAHGSHPAAAVGTVPMPHVSFQPAYGIPMAMADPAAGNVAPIHPVLEPRLHDLAASPAISDAYNSLTGQVRPPAFAPHLHISISLSLSHTHTAS
jgi:hypothetical protein